MVYILVSKIPCARVLFPLTSRRVLTSPLSASFVHSLKGDREDIQGLGPVFWTPSVQSPGCGVSVRAMSKLGEDTIKDLPKQQQEAQPGVEHAMDPAPQYVSDKYCPAGKLKGKTALITGGESGIGRSVACLFVLEGVEAVAITYYGDREEKDKDDTLAILNKLSDGKVKVHAVKVDLGFNDQCERVVQSTVDEFGRIDILVNNASEQHEVSLVSDIDPVQVERTFRSNIFSMFFLTRAALPHMKDGSCIINTTSVTAYRGKPTLLDYSSTKGAIVSFTRSLALQLMEKKIRVNAVAPGPVWTPLIPSSFPDEKIESFGQGTLHKRAAHPVEIAPSYVFLASDDAGFYTGQVLHPNGGSIVSS